MQLFEELNKIGTTVVIATHNETLVGRFQYPQFHLEDGELTPRHQNAVVRTKGDAREIA